MAVGVQDGQRRAGRPRRARPAFALLVVAAIVLRLGREVVGRYAANHWGWWALVALGLSGLVVAIGWRTWRRWRVRRRGVDEFTPESVRAQLAAAGMAEPAFEGDGTLLGSSLMVVNQRPKVLEVYTAYEVLGAEGEPLGSVRQIGQSGFKRFLRVVTVFDQFFTHHFDVTEPTGRVVMRLSRPRKVFRTTLHVFTGDDHFVGSIRQRNVFGKVNFALRDQSGVDVGELRAQNWRAWDFTVVDLDEVTVATVFKSWEGWAQTALSRADRYAVRIERQLDAPLRDLTVAAALAIDLALKQDARGIG